MWNKSVPMRGRSVSGASRTMFHWRISKESEWDNTFFWVSPLNDGATPAGATPAGATPAYARLDSRIGWRFRESLDLSVSGQNLLQPSHAEFPDAIELLHTRNKRSVFAKMTWTF